MQALRCLLINCAREEPLAARPKPTTPGETREKPAEWARLGGGYPLLALALAVLRDWQGVAHFAF